MKSLRKIFIVGVLIIFVMLNTISYGVEVTEENLKQALENYTNSFGSGYESNVEVSNNVITFSSNTVAGQTQFNYDLTDKPTFTSEASISENMSFDEYRKETNKLVQVQMGYIATANIQGVEIKDAMSYILKKLSGSELEHCHSVVEDIDGNIKLQDSENKITKSEFQQQVMEYTNKTFKDTKTLKDSDGINSFEWTYELKDVTDSSCKIVSTLSVNLSADFSKINGNTNQMSDSSTSGNQTSDSENEILVFDEPEEEDEEFSNVESVNESIENKIQSSTQEDLPKTGINNTLYIIIAVIAMAMLLIAFKTHSYKDVK